MKEFQAIYGIFLNQANKVLLFERTRERTYRPSEFDLMGGEIQEGETPEQAFLREVQDKVGIQPKE